MRKRWHRNVTSTSTVDPGATTVPHDPGPVQTFQLSGYYLFISLQGFAFLKNFLHFFFFTVCNSERYFLFSLPASDHLLSCGWNSILLHLPHDLNLTLFSCLTKAMATRICFSFQTHYFCYVYTWP